MTNEREALENLKTCLENFEKGNISTDDFLDAVRVILDHYFIKLNYIDECSDLTGADWDDAMDELGHNLTSHTNGLGPCSRCHKIKVFLEFHKMGARKI